MWLGLVGLTSSSWLPYTLGQVALKEMKKKKRLVGEDVMEKKKQQQRIVE